MRTFLPTTDRIDTNIANNIFDLQQHFKYRKDKLKLLREVEVIIIDEVSMLRADVLDMMDHSFAVLSEETYNLSVAFKCFLLATFINFRQW